MHSWLFLGACAAEIVYKSLALPGHWRGWSWDTRWVLLSLWEMLPLVGSRWQPLISFCVMSLLIPLRGTHRGEGWGCECGSPGHGTAHVCCVRLCCRCVLGCWAQARGEVVLRGGWGLRGAWGTGIIEPGLQHRCGTGQSNCLQQLVCEPGPREVNQPQERVQGACIQ